MQREPIRIRLVPREPVGEQQNARKDFWRAIRQDAEQDQEINLAEGKLRREFGSVLRQLLLRELSAPLRLLDEAFFREFLEGLYFNLPKEDPQLWDFFTRLLEQRQQLFRDTPGIRRVQEKVGAVGLVNFTVRIAGYSSLNLDLSVGSLKSLAEVFDNDFDSFRVFLEAFVPEAFGSVFSMEKADRVDFTVQVPASYEQAFTSTPPSSQPPPAPPAAQAASQPVSTARERAEWLWRLANGSLLVPLLLALLVMYQGMSMLKEIRALQYDAMKPILEHQLKLLEEDRRRLFKEPVAAQAPSSAPTAPTK